jgi:hypothetical protein
MVLTALEVAGFIAMSPTDLGQTCPPCPVDLSHVTDSEAAAPSIRQDGSEHCSSGGEGLVIALFIRSPVPARSAFLPPVHRACHSPSNLSGDDVCDSIRSDVNRKGVDSISVRRGE